MNRLPILENCDDCGDCCLHVVVPPFQIRPGFNEPVLKGVPQSLIEEFLPLWELRFQLPERPCLWFDPETAGCRHYDLRPQACREFEINSPSCFACREKQGS